MSQSDLPPDRKSEPSSEGPVDHLLSHGVAAGANLLLLILYPAAWIAPLAHAGVLPFFQGDAVSVISGIEALWEADLGLAILVALFAIVFPYAKTITLTAIHLGLLGERPLPAIHVMGKLSMADVFLVALYIIIAKGLMIGHVTSAWGLWLFTGCVLASMWVAFATARQLRRQGRA